MRPLKFHPSIIIKWKDYLPKRWSPVVLKSHTYVNTLQLAIQGSSTHSLLFVVEYCAKVTHVQTVYHHFVSTLLSTLRPVGSAPPGGSSVSSHSYVPDIELWTVFITFSVEQKPAAELGWAEDHWAALTCSYNLSEIMLSLCAVLVQAALCSGPSCVILSTEARSPRPLLSSGPSLPLPRLPPATLHSAHCGCGAGNEISRNLISQHVDLESWVRPPEFRTLEHKEKDLC